MTINEMKRLLAGCREGKTLLLISEKSRVFIKKRVTYAAVFENFEERPDDTYAEAPLPPNWLYVEAGPDIHRCMILRNVAEISVITPSKLQALFSVCRSILGKKMFSVKTANELQKNSVLAVQFLNGLLGVTLKSNN